MTDLPAISPEAEPYWEATRERKLLLQRCRACGLHQFYPRALCAHCGGTDLDWTEASGRATVYSRTTVMRSPSPEREAPYVVALVDLAEGPRMLTNLLGDAACDAPVELDWKPHSDGRHLPVFRPL